MADSGAQKIMRDVAVGTARGALLGGPGGALRGAASTAARRAPGLYKARRDARAKGKGGALSGAVEEAKKKLTGIPFWLMIGLTVVKDASDFFFDISVVLSFLVVVTGLVVSFSVAFYLIMNDVKPTSRKIVIWAISVAIEAFPFLSLLPTATISLSLIRVLENNELIKGALGHKMGGLGGLPTRGSIKPT